MRPSPLLDWQPPAGWLRIRTVDAHTAGEPFRVVVEGFPELVGDTMLARRRDARERCDDLRRALMWEPRGHADMYGCVLTPPLDGGADFGILFMHNEGFSTMCGHGIIAITKVAVEGGMVPVEEPETKLAIDTPAGRVYSRAAVEGGRVRRVAFRNVPSFAVSLDGEVAVPGIGAVRYDLAFGGAFYAYVEAEDLGLELTAGAHRLLIERGREIRRAVAAAEEIEHPEAEDLGFLYGVVFTGRAVEPAHHSRNVCVFADGEVDRSPTGTSVSARLALLAARGELGEGERIVIESLLGTTFTGRIVGSARVGDFPAVVPEVGGTAHITGRHEFLLDPEDPLRGGFLLR